MIPPVIAAITVAVGETSSYVECSRIEDLISKESPGAQDQIGPNKSIGDGMVGAEVQAHHEICANCIHWNPTGGDGEALTGACRRFPPQVFPYIQINENPVITKNPLGQAEQSRFSASSDGLFAFPGTDRFAWCGEFKMMDEPRV